MAKQLSISAARKALFGLFEQVTAVEGVKVVIGHRNSLKQAVLVDKDYVESLERVRHGTSRLASRRPFSLFGSATLLVPADEVLTDIRREQRVLVERKARRLDPVAKRR